ncbi:hypothetical protein V5799_011266 [Amblyomma americanum]|uniref:Uncharacterized protein n=1 Tax=Amblyomma americanum TaxID=6943 RepID=A0AAQ4EHD2_AMBAM
MGRSRTSDRVNTVVNWRYFSGHGNGPTVTMLDVSYLRFVQFLICLACCPLYDTEPNYQPLIVPVPFLICLTRCPFYDTEPNYQPIIVPVPVSNSSRTYHQAAENGYSVFYNDTFVCYKRTATSLETSPTSERFLICLTRCPFYDTEPNYQPIIVPVPVSNSSRTYHQAAENGYSVFYNDTFVCYKRTATSLETSPTSERFLICLTRCPFYDTEPNYQPLIVTVPVSNSSRTYHQAAENGYSVFYNDTFVCYKRTATSLETSPTSERVNTVVNWRHFSGHGNGIHQ